MTGACRDPEDMGILGYGSDKGQSISRNVHLAGNYNDNDLKSDT